MFSNQFLLAALNRVINADTLQAAVKSKEILMNELGVIYNNKGDKPGAHHAAGDRATAAGNPNSDREGDPALVATEGTVDGGKFRFQAAHFEWLLRFGEPLGLTFDDMGKRRHGTPTTIHFCDELFRLYGSDDYNEAMGASFAVENWAAAGFWKELIAGLESVKARSVPDLPLAFFTWHDKIEDQHREHTWDELARVLRLGQIPRGAVHPRWREDARRRESLLGWVERPAQTSTRQGGVSLRSRA